MTMRIAKLEMRLRNQQGDSRKTYTATKWSVTDAAGRTVVAGPAGASNSQVSRQLDSRSLQCQRHCTSGREDAPLADPGLKVRVGRGFLRQDR